MATCMRDEQVLERVGGKLKKTVVTVRSRRHIYKDGKCKRCGKPQTWPKKQVERT